LFHYSVLSFNSHKINDKLNKFPHTFNAWHKHESKKIFEPIALIFDILRTSHNNKVTLNMSSYSPRLRNF